VSVQLPRFCLAAVVLCAATAALAGCSPTSAKPGDPLLEIPVPAHVTVQARDIHGLGEALVDGKGLTLYMFPPDAGSRVTCTGGCTGIWPPLVISTKDKPTAGPGVNALDLGTLHDPNTGAMVVTYGGFPLYRYSGDLKAGTADGQGLFLNGGPWYALNPDMVPITTIPGPTS
jgi:predicted lipoprotein with Yx(FWY)xxD motif